jgi:hypothetical protein
MPKIRKILQGPKLRQRVRSNFCKSANLRNSVREPFAERTNFTTTSTLLPRNNLVPLSQTQLQLQTHTEQNNINLCNKNNNRNNDDRVGNNNTEEGVIMYDKV